jgi:hypothetical protein
MFQHKSIFQRLQFLVLPAALGVMTLSPLSAAPADSDDTVTFKMVVSAAGKACLPEATGTVSITPGVQAETMDVSVQGLAPETEFEFFVIQVPKTPFGVAWYQGSIVTDKKGRGRQQFVGRFSIETFSTAQGSAPAPIVFGTGPFPDANTNPVFQPVHSYHLGLWFSSPQAAQAANCPAATTPFSGEHTAGFQILNTSNFPDDHGPLRDVASATSKK